MGLSPTGLSHYPKGGAHQHQAKAACERVQHQLTIVTRQQHNSVAVGPDSGKMFSHHARLETIAWKAVTDVDVYLTP